MQLGKRRVTHQRWLASACYFALDDHFEEFAANLVHKGAQCESKRSRLRDDDTGSLERRTLYLLPSKLAGLSSSAQGCS